MTTCTDCNELVRHCTCGMTRAERKVFLPAAPGYAADGRTPLHNVPGRELLVSAVAFNGAVAEIARLQAQVAELQALSVTHIMTAVVPGEGSGQEVYAKSVADVEALLSKLGERAEEADSLQAQVDALAGALQALMRADSDPGRAVLDKCRAALAAAGR